MKLAAEFALKFTLGMLNITLNQCLYVLYVWGSKRMCLGTVHDEQKSVLTRLCGTPRCAEVDKV